MAPRRVRETYAMKKGRTEQADVIVCAIALRYRDPVAFTESQVRPPSKASEIIKLAGL